MGSLLPARHLIITINYNSIDVSSGRTGNKAAHVFFRLLFHLKRARIKSIFRSQQTYFIHCSMHLPTHADLSPDSVDSPVDNLSLIHI